MRKHVDRVGYEHMLLLSSLLLLRNRPNEAIDVISEALQALAARDGVSLDTGDEPAMLNEVKVPSTLPLALRLKVRTYAGTSAAACVWCTKPLN